MSSEPPPHNFYILLRTSIAMSVQIDPKLVSASNANSTSSKKAEVVGIQYLRGIAAIAVVFDHSAGMGAFDKYFGVTIFNNFLMYGAHGVDIFFVVSGFIIAYVALRPKAFVPELTLLDFLKKRAIRILPLMWLAISSYAILRMLGGVSANWADYLRAAFLFPVGQVAPLNIWTLRHEMLFYFLFGLTWLGYPLIRYGIFLWFAGPVLSALLGGTGRNDLWDFLVSPVNLEFGVGFCLGLLYLRVGCAKAVISYQFGLLVSATVIMITLAFFYGRTLGSLESVVFTSLCSAPIVAFAAFTSPAKRNRLGILLGEASYSIYLFHPHIISAVLRLLKSAVPNLPPHGAILLAACTGIAGGMIIHRFIERPLLTRFKSNFSNRRAPNLAAT
ncbi:acyltransferase family protein [Bradyrhizobium yuanmingense]|uniref:acyltransferase family protein n=1 Tax=Bradyrhizobium yuanmingense TaxID=108015 RepID=UPI0012FC7FD6|nr:acyltransferase [Bradyrhizobium yuanmingense]